MLWFRRDPTPRHGRGEGDSPVTGKARRNAAILLSCGLVFLAVAYVLVLYLTKPPDTGDGMRWDQFVSGLSDHRIANATVLAVDRRIVGQYDGGRYWVDYGNDINLVPTLTMLQNSKVPVVVDNQWSKQLIGPLTLIFPSLILVDALLLMIVLLRSRDGGLLGFGRASPRRLQVGESKITFSDVAGVDEAVEELAEVKDYLASPERFLAMGARVPRGILLVGPPGCGKTLLARALSGEAGVPFFSISGSDFVEMFVGVGAARIRDLFREAQEAAPSIVFIDELDAVGRGRSPAAVGGQDEREATLNQLLVGLDGFDEGSGVVVLAATNRPDVLDGALLRPGRFDRRVFVDRPDLSGRLGILAVHARGKPMAEGVDLQQLAKRTAGFSGADLASVVNEAALLAARRGAREINGALLQEATERVLAGPERKSRILEPKDKRLIAFHEAGHAVVSTLLDPGYRVNKISVVSRSTAGGFTWYMPEEETVVATRSQLEARLATLMGGRAAEELVSGEPSTGAHNDLERASIIARRMVCELGMSEKVGPVALHHSPARLEADGGVAVPWSESVSAVADGEIKRLLSEALAAARRELERHREMLDRIAERLVEVESLEGPELDQLLNPGPRLAVGR